jgi:hypothetical protein
MNRAAEAAGRDTDTAKMCQTLVNETKGVLELHLDPNVDPSLTVRAVYGQWFPWLTVLDRAWAEQIASDVFPAAEGAEAYWHAAWDAYITWTQPYNEMLALLDDHYRLAISRASDDAGQRLGATSSPAERLAEHIVIFYWRGLIDLADETSILHQLFADGPAELRSRAIGFVGQALSNEATADSLPGEVKERLQALWAWRVDQATLAKQARPLLNELNAFGWWASSPAFDDDWVLDQLTTVMSLGGHPEPDFVVLERLVRTALPFPGRTVTLLAEYLKSQKQPWSVLGHRDEIASIVESAILSKDRTALTGTVDLLEWLGAQGFQEFRPTYDRAAAVLAGFT